MPCQRQGFCLQMCCLLGATIRRWPFGFRASGFLPAATPYGAYGVWSWLGILLVALFPIIGTAGEALPGGAVLNAVVHPAVAPAGSTVELALSLELPPGWIAFDTEQAANSVLPTRIALERAVDFVPLGAMRRSPAAERPDERFNRRVIRYFTTSPTFKRTYALAEDAMVGTRVLVGRVDLMLCDEQAGRCYVIRKHPFQTTLQVTAPVEKPWVKAQEGAQGATNSSTTVFAWQPVRVGSEVAEVANGAVAPPPVEKDEPGEEAAGEGDIFPEGPALALPAPKKVVATPAVLFPPRPPLPKEASVVATLTSATWPPAPTAPVCHDRIPGPLPSGAALVEAIPPDDDSAHAIASSPAPHDSAETDIAPNEAPRVAAQRTAWKQRVRHYGIEAVSAENIHRPLPPGNYIVLTGSNRVVSLRSDTRLPGAHKDDSDRPDYQSWLFGAGYLVMLLWLSLRRNY